MALLSCKALFEAGPANGVACEAISGIRLRRGGYLRVAKRGLARGTVHDGRHGGQVRRPRGGQDRRPRGQRGSLRTTGRPQPPPGPRSCRAPAALGLKPGGFAELVGGRPAGWPPSRSWNHRPTGSRWVKCRRWRGSLSHRVDEQVPFGCLGGRGGLRPYPLSPATTPTRLSSHATCRDYHPNDAAIEITKARPVCLSLPCM